MMAESDTYLARVMRVISANLGIAALAYVGLAITTNLSGASLYLLVFVVSLLQGGLTVRAFGPATGSESGLSFAGQIAGWIGLLGWLLLHLLNKEILATESVQGGLWAVFVELIAYGILNTIILVPFYTQRLRARRTATEFQKSGAVLRDAEQHKSHAAEDNKSSDQRRRDNARFACERFYDRYRKDLTNNFPPNRLDDYIERYLGDDHPADEVEDRAEQLRATLQELLDHNGSDRPRYQSIVELREFYREERVRIDTADMESDLKDTLLTDLAREEESAIRECRQR